MLVIKIRKITVLLICISFLGVDFQAIAQTDPGDLDDLKILNRNEGNLSFGGAVSIYQNHHAAVSAPFEDRVHIFTQDSLSFPWRVRHTFYPDSFSGLFGWSLAMSADFLIIGDWFDDELYTSAGAAHVYQKKPDGGWYFLQKLLPTSVDSALYFGSTLEIQGNILAITNGKSESFNKPGGLHVFEFNGVEFELVDTISGHINGLNPPVDLDGDRIVVGDEFDSSITSSNGKVIVYERTNGSWNFSTYIFPSSPMPFTNFGGSVTIEGDRIIAGAHGSNKAFHYKNIGGTWAQIQELIPSIAGTFAEDMDMQADSLWITGSTRGFLFVLQADTFIEKWNTTEIRNSIAYKGTSVVTNAFSGQVLTRTASSYSISNVSDDDDDYCDPLVYCNYGDDVAISDETFVVGSENAVWVYEKVDTGWIEKSLLHGDGQVLAMQDDRIFYKYFSNEILITERRGETWKIIQSISPPESSGTGFASAMAADNNYLIVGEFNADTAGAQSGVVYVYKRTSSTYTFDQLLLPNVPGGFFGQSVDINNNKIIVGADFDNNQGAAYIYELIGNNWVLDEKIVAPDGQNSDLFGRSVAIGQSFAAIGATGVDDGGFNSEGATYIFQQTPGWTFSEKLANESPASFDFCGASVSLSYNNLMVSCPGAIGEGVFLYKNIGGIFQKVDSFLSFNDNIQEVYVKNENFAIGGPEEASIGQTTTDCYGHLLLDFFITPGLYFAENKITATGFVLPGSVTLSAEDEIIMHHPFEVGMNAELETDNGGCP